MTHPIKYAVATALFLASFIMGTASGLAASKKPPTNLRPDTMEAFQHYVSLTDERNAEELRPGGPFLWVDALPAKSRNEAYAALRRGEVMVERIETVENGKPVKCPRGMIHDWVGVVFIPGATLGQALAQAQDYTEHPRMYAPSEVRAKILEHDGNHFKVSIRYVNTKLVNVVLDVVFDFHFHALDATRAWSFSRTLSVHQVEDAGTPQEVALPEGEGSGYLWSMVTYSRYEQRDGGTYVQTESIALSRGIPPILAWLLGPLTRSIPRRVLTFVLEHTRTAVLHPPAS